MASPVSAAAAYAKIARMADPSLGRPGIGAGVAPTDNGASFSSVLKEALNSVSETGRKSDAQTQSMVNGKGNMVDVVTAVAETEVAISAVVAVRDRVIHAYEEIMRMPI